MNKVILLTLTLCFLVLGCSTPPPIQQLKDLGINYDKESFFKEIENGNYNHVKLFLLAGMDVNSKDKAGDTPLIKAISKDHDNIVELLLNNHADPNLENANGTTPLISASAMNEEDIVSLLISKKVNLEYKDHNGYNALMMAVRNGDLKVTKILLDAGANPNIIEGKVKEDLTNFIKIYPEIGELLKKYGAKI